MAGEFCLWVATPIEAVAVEPVRGDHGVVGIGEGVDGGVGCDHLGGVTDMSVGEEFAESGFAIHDTVPGDELSGSLVVSGLAEESSLVGASVPFGVSFDLEGAFKFDFDGVT